MNRVDLSSVCMICQVGDLLMSVNSTSLLGLSHKESIRAIRQNSDTSVVTLRICECLELSQGTHNFVPSWIYWLQTPVSVSFLHTITASLIKHHFLPDILIIIFLHLLDYKLTLRTHCHLTVKKLTKTWHFFQKN